MTEPSPLSGWSRPSPSRGLLFGAGLFYVVFLAYSVFILQATLVGVGLGLLVIGGYYLWRLLVAVEAIADGVHRVAQRRERE